MGSAQSIMIENERFLERPIRGGREPKRSHTDHCRLGWSPHPSDAR
jgi:hypothetical protein